MTLQRIQQGSRFEQEIGYARAVVDDHYVHVSGTTGYDYATHTIDPDIAAQCRQALKNVAWALDQAGTDVAQIVRVTYYLTNAADFPACWPALREAFAANPPAATMLTVAALADPAMRFEIEVTAVRKGRK